VPSAAGVLKSSVKALVKPLGTAVGIAGAVVVALVLPLAVVLLLELLDEDDELLLDELEELLVELLLLGLLPDGTEFSNHSSLLGLCFVVLHVYISTFVLVACDPPLSSRHRPPEPKLSN